MLRLALSSLRHRRAGLLGAFVALLFSAALLTACGALFQTGLLGTVATQRYAHTPVLVSADQSLHFVKSKGKVKAKPLTEHAWLSSDVTERLATVPGGSGAVPELSFPADVAGASADPGPRGQSWGHGWSSASLTPFTLASGRAPSGDDEVVVDAGLAGRLRLAPGDTTVIQTAAGRAAYRVVGVTRQSLRDQNALFFNDSRARQLAGHPGQIFALGLPHATAADLPGLRRALDGTGDKVVTGAGRGLLEFEGAAKAKATLISLSAVLGGASLIAAMLVVSATVALSIGQRNRELALLRAVGATPRQVRRMIGIEALGVGVVAGALGSGAGLGMAEWLRQRFVALHAMPANLTLRPAVLPAVGAFVVTVLAGWIAARLCARRISTIDPRHALVEAAVAPARVGRARLVLGMAALVGFAILLQLLPALHTDAAAQPVSLVATLLAVACVALLGPLLARSASAALTMPITVLGGRTGELAAANNRANPRRLASVTTPLTLAVALTGPIAFAPATLEHAAAAQRVADVHADAAVQPAGPGLPADVVARVLTAPGVQAANVERRSMLRLGQDRYSVSGMTPGAVGQTVDLGVSSGSVDALGEDGVALSGQAAGHHHLRVGDRTTMTMGDGVKVTLTVRAVYAHRLAFGDVVLATDLLQAHVDNPAADDILVRSSEPSTLAAALGTAPARIVNPRQATAAVTDAQRMSNDIGYLAWGLVILFAVIAVLNSLAMATAGRTSEFASLRLVGMGKPQVRRMVSVETTALSATAVTAGSAIAFAVLSAYTAGMTQGAGVYAPPLELAAVLVAAALLTTIATALPARLSLRANPAELLNAQP